MQFYSTREICENLMHAKNVFTVCSDHCAKLGIIPLCYSACRLFTFAAVVWSMNGWNIVPKGGLVSLIHVDLKFS